MLNKAKKLPTIEHSCFSFESAGANKVRITKFVVKDGEAVHIKTEEMTKLAAITWFKKKLFDLLIRN